MRDIYLYDDCNVLRNLLNIKDVKLLTGSNGRNGALD